MNTVSEAGREHLRLGVNIDHVATLRNARGGRHPDPVRAAELALAAGADGITVHLREDRRHIRDADVRAIKAAIAAPINFEMAATTEMVGFAQAVLPHAACIVPERRAEVTTEGGLDAAGQRNALAGPVKDLAAAGIRVSLFIDADHRQADAAVAIGAPVIELHTGRYCEAVEAGERALASEELARITDAAIYAQALGLEVHAGHGLSYHSVGPIAAIGPVRELNIGHFLIGEAVFLGLGPAIAEMRRLMAAARRPALADKPLLGFEPA